jgi:hypothetical protein
MISVETIHKARKQSNEAWMWASYCHQSLTDILFVEGKLYVVERGRVNLHVHRVLEHNQPERQDYIHE